MYLKKYGWIIYLLALHIIVWLAIFDPYLILSQRWRLGLGDISASIKEKLLLTDFMAIDTPPIGMDAPEDKINVLIGASHLRHFNHTMLDKKFMNLAISGRKIENLYDDLRQMPLSKHFKNVILLVGGNDILHNSKKADFIVKKTQQLIENIDLTEGFIILTLPPVGRSLQAEMGKEIIHYNQMMSDYCLFSKKCTVINIFDQLASADGLLRDYYNSGDDLHLSHGAYLVISKAINKYFKVPKNKPHNKQKNKELGNASASAQ